jgi:hypothetical protein
VENTWAGARLGVQDPDDLIARGPRRVDQPVHVRGDIRIGDRLPQRVLAEGLLDVDDEKGTFHAIIVGWPAGRPHGSDKPSNGPI